MSSTKSRLRQSLNKGPTPAAQPAHKAVTVHDRLIPNLLSEPETSLPDSDNADPVSIVQVELLRQDLSNVQSELQQTTKELELERQSNVTLSGQVRDLEKTIDELQIKLSDAQSQFGSLKKATEQERDLLVAERNTLIEEKAILTKQLEEFEYHLQQHSFTANPSSNDIVKEYAKERMLKNFGVKMSEVHKLYSFYLDNEVAERIKPYLDQSVTDKSTALNAALDYFLKQQGL